MKFTINIIIAFVLFLIVSVVSFTSEDMLAEYSATTLNALYKSKADYLAFKAEAGELILIDRQEVLTADGVKFFNSIHRFQFFTHFVFPILLSVLLGVVLFTIKEKKKFLFGMISFASAIAYLKLMTPFWVDMNTEYYYNGVEFISQDPSFLLQAALIPLKKLFHGYGAIGMRLFLPIIIFTLLIFKEVSSSSLISAAAMPKHKPQCHQSRSI